MLLTLERLIRCICIFIISDDCSFVNILNLTPYDFFLSGCYFMNKHYETGHVIETNDPCMNCSCTNAAMMCYLRVCPFIKPLGENCHMEKHVGDCCPKYWCPEGRQKIIVYGTYKCVYVCVYVCNNEIISASILN